MPSNLPHGPQLTRYSLGAEDELGTVDQWSQPMHDLYAVQPFPSLWQQLRRINAWHMDHAQLDAETAAKIANLQDYDTITPGCQVAAGLFFDGDRGIDVGVFPNGWTPDYNGPRRFIPPNAVANAVSVLYHESGHFLMWACRILSGQDDISKKASQLLTDFAAGQNQASNLSEYFAELFRALVKGTFSDEKAFTFPPDLKSLLLCLYWLTAALKGYWVVSLAPGNGGCMYQVFIDGWFRWRWISSVDWHSEEWTGSVWKRI